jgi:RES domain-containing protein
VNISNAWDATAAVAARPVIAWSGCVWRAHKKTYEATDAGGALRYSARYNRAPDLFPVGSTWPVLYCGLTYGLCLAETMRHLTPDTLPSLKNQRLSELSVELSAVLDCTDLAALGVDGAALFDDYDYSTGQTLAAAAIARGCEALLIPSATRLPDPNLIIFTTRIQPSSSYRAIGFVDPPLYVDRQPI